MTVLAEAKIPYSPVPGRARKATFSSLRTRNFRLFATGQLFSNTGAWAQRVAQDWLVLSLTGSAAAVGVTTALQFLPTLLGPRMGMLIAGAVPAVATTLIVTKLACAAPWPIYSRIGRFAQ
jgi:hypothetical protein